MDSRTSSILINLDLNLDSGLIVSKYSNSIAGIIYRDRIERQSFHKSFLQFGIILYLMVMLVQYLLGRETYLVLLEETAELESKTPSGKEAAE